MIPSIWPSSPWTDDPLAHWPFSTTWSAEISNDRPSSAQYKDFIELLKQRLEARASPSGEDDFLKKITAKEIMDIARALDMDPNTIVNQLEKELEEQKKRKQAGGSRTSFPAPKKIDHGWNLEAPEFIPRQCSFGFRQNIPPHFPQQMPFCMMYPMPPFMYSMPFNYIPLYHPLPGYPHCPPPLYRPQRHLDERLPAP